MAAPYHEANTNFSLSIRDAQRLPRGLAYGEACFETFCVRRGEISHWRRHARRLQEGLASFGYLLDEGMLARLHAHCIQAVGEMEACVRLTVAAGDAAWGLFARCEQLVAYVQTMSLDELQSPGAVSLRTIAYPFAPRPKPAKYVGDYGEMLRAIRIVGERDVIWHADGRLLGGVNANCWIYRHGTWHTPSLDAGVLPGVARSCLLDSGIGREARCPADWLRDCDALALSNAVRGIMPVKRIDGRQLDVAHPALQQLAAAWQERINR